MLASVRNTSTVPLVLRRIEPVGLLPLDADVSVTLAPRSTNPTGLVPLGFYYVYPPAARVGGSCSRQRVVRPEGYVLRPARGHADLTMLVVRGRTTRPGVLRLDGERIVYEQNGRLFYEDIPFGVRIHVRNGAHVTVPPEQRACAD